MIRLQTRFSMERNKQSSRILITRFSALGDVAIAVPVVYSVCRSNPDKEFIFITKRPAGQLFINAPANLTVEEIDTTKYSGVVGLWRLARELRRKYNIDTMADLHDVLRTKILRTFMRMGGVKVRHIHKGRRGKRALTRPHNKVMLPLITSRARYREVFYSLAIGYADKYVNLFENCEANPQLYASATPPKRNGETWIAIAPGAKHLGKIYPPELMEDVIKTLSKRKNHKIFLFGAGEEETRQISLWCMRYDNLVNMAKLHLGLAAELNLFRACDAMISMDSANMHLASIAGTRVVSIWGATHPFCGFTGWKQDKKDCVQMNMVCRPCSVFGNKPCRRGDLLCMYGIKPERVIEVLDRVVNK